ncbi:hypothetical protein O181_035511 [Austropuccinia psidii MF-1]|uniref:Uncharacterized protein n=1 Tax=Austropuccinia psidii MF-1 TaxID=1389203 RepID=A0A9Q3D2S1_9BASI|nr:hypothetical protein [Austropuccinia psidii MF-1]
MENTGSEVFSGNTTVNFSLESILSPACKPNTLKDCSKEIDANTIKTKNNPGNNPKPKISNFVRPLSSNQYETNTNKGYIKKGQMSRPNTSRASSRINEIELATIDTTINKNKEETIDVTDTENNEKRILNKIKSYIEKKITDQHITIKLQISWALLDIIRNIHNERDLYYYLKSNTPYSILKNQIESALIQKSFHKKKINTNELKVAEVAKKKNSCHNRGSTDHYANHGPKAKKKAYAIENVTEEESATKDSDSDSMGDAIREQSDDYQDPREEFLVEYQEETPLEIQAIQLEAGMPQDTESKKL